MINKQKFCIANWKMNLNQNESSNYLNIFNKFDLNDPCIETIICPTFTSMNLFINDKQELYKLGAQNVSSFNKGSYTGDVSVEMLKHIGCSYVIVGHSDRRIYFNEVNNDIKLKFDLVYKSSMVPILCIGENFKERESDKYKNVLNEQINSVLSSYTEFNKDILIAYEPVWAIGTGESASAIVIEETHAIIKNIIKNYTLNNCNIYILYGGSVNEKNASKIARINNVDGFLIGSSSLDPKIFYNIYNSLKGE